jgi:hypothetical protein
MFEHLDYIKKMLIAAPLRKSCGPWQLIAERAIGGLLAVGFERSSEDLLIISTNGQSVLDCTSGILLSRDNKEKSYDNHQLYGRRLDNPKAPQIDMAGISGGGLKRETPDGWTIDSFPVEWPKSYLVLQPPGASIYMNAPKFLEYKKDGTFCLLWKGVESGVAFGFSWTGKTLVLATTSEIYVWARD